MVTNGIITTVAGRNNGAPPIDGEEAVNARLEGPTGVTVDRSGQLLFRGVRDRVGHGPGAGRLQGLEGLRGGHPHHVRGQRHCRAIRATERRPRRRNSTGRPEWRWSRPGLCTSRTRRISGCVRVAPGGTLATRGGYRRGGVQWRDRLAAHRATQSSAGGGGGCAGQLVCRGHGEQPGAKGAAGRQPVHHRGQWKRQLFRRWRAGDQRPA